MLDLPEKGGDDINTTNIIGLFGTCGSSTWRTAFVKRYKELGIPFFNPQVDEWKPEDAYIESLNLINDRIILCPITKETYGLGSLSEVGFSILSAIDLNSRRYFVVMIDQELDESLDDPIARKESLKARALVLEHLTKLRVEGTVYIVSNLEEMLEVSIKLYEAIIISEKLKAYTPSSKREEQLKIRA